MGSELIFTAPGGQQLAHLVLACQLAMALAALRQWALRSPWGRLLAPRKLQGQQEGQRTRDEEVQATLSALMARAEGRPPEDTRAKRAVCFSTALEMKFSGNSLFKKGAYADAVSTYERGLDALEALNRIHVDAVRVTLWFSNAGVLKSTVIVLDARSLDPRFAGTARWKLDLLCAFE